MTGHYFSRWKYLYFTFYRQKLGYKKFRSFTLATLFGLVSKIIYQGVRLIPTYPDIRLRETINESLEHLKVNNSILIFPEDSSSGYGEKIEAFHAGFVYLAQQYFKKNNEHIPLIPLYYHKAKQQIITGKTKYLNDFEANLTKEEIAESLRKSLNGLGL